MFAGCGGPEHTGDNQPAPKGSVHLEPATVFSLDEVVCVPEGDDKLTWQITWERDGEPFTGTGTRDHEGDTIPAHNVGYDEKWTCKATPELGTTKGTPAFAEFTTDPPPGGNVLIIVADDLGIDNMASWGVAPDPPATPTLDRLADEGMIFRNTWAYSVCSPSRAAMMTGRMGRRTGVANVMGFTSWFELPLEEVTIPEALSTGTWFDYSTSALGKWHMGSYAASAGAAHPLAQGFEYHAGSPGNLDANTGGYESGYYRWEKLINGAVTYSELYATTDTTNEAIIRIETMQEPWLAWVAYNAPHFPWHVPPDELHTQQGLTEDSPNPVLFDAAIEALDTEIGRMLTRIDPEMLARTTIIFIGDNGTPYPVITPPFDSRRAKNTPYEGGINVPMIVWGPLVQQPGTETQALVHAVDIFATVSAIAGVNTGELGVELDGQPFNRWLADPSAPSLRQTMYAEQISPNGGADYFNEDIGIVRNERYKLIRSAGQGDAFYDMQSSVYDEGPDIMGGVLSAPEQEAYSALDEALNKIQPTLVYEGPERPD